MKVDVVCLISWSSTDFAERSLLILRLVISGHVLEFTAAGANTNLCASCTMRKLFKHSANAIGSYIIRTSKSVVRSERLFNP